MPRITPTSRALQHAMQSLERLVLEHGLDGRPRLPPERELAQRFGVSRTTLRAAIQSLVSRGMLEPRQGSGVFIASDRPAAAATPWPPAPWLGLVDTHPALRADTLEFRMVFECAAVRFAAQRAEADERRQLAATVRTMRQAVREGDVAAEAAADAAFHAQLASASHNMMLGRFYANAIASLREHITRNTYEAGRDAALASRRAQQRLGQHEAICDAILRQSPDDAALAMREHIEFVGRQFQA
ncbi:FadR/GntR family transcriptional regulator [Bordetella bronchialis]|uniref:GntR family transcriptional regulator n=1 Tax=Bordetella bronchialis TaxID=463025 RepID=A0A193G1N8_9BORD|nr:FCD domain-containing protein [Bordetella bronchialis]ANN73366.1 GntR family transcriptional regulator [Bordetella bronchialis]